MEDIILDDEWTLFFSNQDRHGDQSHLAEFMDNIHPIMTTDSLKVFFSCYQFLRRPNVIDCNQGYHFFKKGIRPAFEDPAHVKCIRIKIMIASGYASMVWEYLLMMIFRGLLDECPKVTGIEFRRGKVVANEFIAIWMRDKTEEDQKNLLAILKREFNLQDTSMFHIQP